MTRKFTNEEYAKMIKNNHLNLIGDYNGLRNPVEVECDICGNTWTTMGQNPLRYHGCKVCLKETFKKYNKENCIKNKCQWMYDCLYDKNDGEKYGYCSNEKTYFICPHCGSKLYKRVSDVYTYGLGCHVCSDGVSYPNKFIRNVLKQLNIDFISEYSPDWAGHYKYDVYFKLDNDEYIIEMDGFGHGFVDTPYSTMEEQIKVDKIKDDLAFNNGIHLIRVNCHYRTSVEDRFNLVKENICKSLSWLLDLTTVDWNECNYFSSSSNVKICADMWNNGIYCNEDYLSELNLKSAITINHYLRTAYDLGLIKDDYKEIEHKRRSAAIKRANIRKNTN